MPDKNLEINLKVNGVSKAASDIRSVANEARKTAIAQAQLDNWGFNNQIRLARESASKRIAEMRKTAIEAERLEKKLDRVRSMRLDNIFTGGRSMLLGLTEISAGFNKMWFFAGRVYTVSSMIVGTITKIGLVLGGATVAAGGLAAIIGGKLFSSVMKVSESFRKLQIAQLGIFKDVGFVNNISKWAQEYSATRPGTYEDTMNLVTGLSFSPALKNKIAKDPRQLTMLSDLVQGMAMMNPNVAQGGGIEGARIAIQEALAGQFTSLQRRFNVPKSTIFGYFGLPKDASKQDLAAAKNDPEKVLRALQKFKEEYVPQTTLNLGARTFGVQTGNILDRIKMFLQSIGGGGTTSFVGSDKFGRREGGIYGFATASLERLNNRIAKFMSSPGASRMASGISGSMIDLWSKGESAMGRIFGGVSPDKSIKANISQIWENLKSEGSRWFSWVKAKVSELIQWINTTGIEALKKGLTQVNTLIDEMVAGKDSQPKWVQFIINGIDKARDLAKKIKDIFEDQNTVKSMISVAKAFGNVAQAMGKVIEQFSKLPEGVQTSLATGFLINQSGALQVAGGAGKIVGGAVSIASGMTLGEIIKAGVKRIFTGKTTKTAISDVITKSDAIPNSIAGGIKTAITSPASIALIGAAVAGAIATAKVGWDTKQQLDSDKEAIAKADAESLRNQKRMGEMRAEKAQKWRSENEEIEKQAKIRKSLFEKYGSVSDETVRAEIARLSGKSSAKSPQEYDVESEMRGADEWYRRHAPRNGRDLYSDPYYGKNMTMSNPNLASAVSNAIGLAGSAQEQEFLQSLNYADTGDKWNVYGNVYLTAKETTEILRNLGRSTEPSDTASFRRRIQ